MCVGESPYSLGQNCFRCPCQAMGGQRVSGGLRAWMPGLDGEIVGGLSLMNRVAVSVVKNILAPWTLCSRMIWLGRDYSGPFMNSYD